jgi:hypothetical protein
LEGCLTTNNVNSIAVKPRNYRSNRINGLSPESKTAQAKQHEVNATGPLRADLIGISQATCSGVTVSGRHAPVFSLCRALIEAGHDPDAPLEAYRGEILCLRASSLAAGAALIVKESTKDGRPRFATYRPGPDGQERERERVRGRAGSNFEGGTLPETPGEEIAASAG